MLLPLPPRRSGSDAAMTGATSQRVEPAPIVELDEVGSTNLEAIRRATDGERGPLWITAKRQTAGRGRLGRTWSSDAGNLAATLLVAPGCAPAHLHQLSLVAGVAAFDALATILTAAPRRPDLRLKWPNDILADGAKLGGILIESTTIGREAIAAVGIGINVATAPAIEGRPTAALHRWLPTADRRATLYALAVSMAERLAVWDDARGFAAIRAAWIERALLPGTPISINAGVETVAGVVSGIDETGALLMGSVSANPDEIRRFTFGDVDLLPPHD